MHYKELVQKQRDFFNSKATLPVEFRKQQLKKLRELVVQNKDAYVDAIYNDLRRPKQMAGNEIDQIVSEIDFFIENLDNWVKPEAKGSESFGNLFLYKIPLGVILNISPFNFPIGLSLRPLAAALAAGNTMILKPSELSEHSEAILDKTLSVFPKELIAVVKGDAKITTALLEERFDHIFYTGSPAIGKIVMTAASQHLTPVTLELGGKCPTVILEDTDIQKTAEKIVNGKWYNCGQVCLSVDYVMVEDKVKDKFLDAIKEHTQRIFGDKPKESPLYPRMINNNHFNRINNLLQATKGKLVYKAKDENSHDEHYVGPHIFEVDREDPLMEDEVFGPILSVLPVKNVEEAIEFINKGEKPLASYIFTENEQKIEKFFEEVHSGNCVSNGVMLNYASIKIPFGGVGNSGIGRYHGKFGFDTFSHEKAAVKSSL